jgi:hypothetical protein
LRNHGLPNRNRGLPNRSQGLPNGGWRRLCQASRWDRWPYRLRDQVQASLWLRCLQSSLWRPCLHSPRCWIQGLLNRQGWRQGPRQASRRRCLHSPRCWIQGLPNRQGWRQGPRRVSRHGFRQEGRDKSSCVWVGAPPPRWQWTNGSMCCVLPAFIFSDL